MSKLINKSFIIMAALFAAMACTDVNIDIEGGQDDGSDFSSLHIGYTFSWKMTVAYNINISSTKGTEFSFFTEEACENLLISGNVPAGETVTVTVNVPEGTECIYLKYVSEDGPTVKPIQLTQTKAGEASVLITDAVETGYDDDWRLQSFVPGKDKNGTLLFEDLYPGIGDYDFNDLVVYYNIANTKSYGFTSNMTDESVITFTIKSKGGSIQSDFGVELTGIPASFAAQYATVTVDGEPVEGALKTSGDASAVFMVSTDGGKYDTEKKMSIVDKTVKITMSKDNLDDLVSATYFSSLFDMDNINWFMNVNGTEIHLKGFKATALAPSQASDTFASKDNLVWGLNVPVELIPAKEKVDFLLAYPDFRKWVESDSYVWYNTPVTSNLAW